jgi:NodT family efflux transporter outer membrane factor (OMF) lipoprotein
MTMTRKQSSSIKCWLSLLSVSLVAGCSVGPDYVRPEAPMAAEFKPAPGWKIADPDDDVSKGEWWKIYKDPTLDELMAQVSPNNQNIAIYVARVRQAQALASGANAARYPTFGVNADGGRIASGTGNKNDLVNPDGSINNGAIFNNVNLYGGISWDSDLWGKLRRNVESKDASLVASVADLENAKLSMQTQLAQAYFLVRSLDSQKQLLSDTTASNLEAVRLTKNQYDVGVKARQDLINAGSQYRSVQAQLIDVGVNRAAQESLIAVLIGKPPSDFSIAFNPLPARSNLMVPVVPPGLPTDLLERRPDVAAAERRMAVANAQIGYQMAAYFPSLTLNSSQNNIGYLGQSFSQLLTAPFLYWGIGPSLALTVLDFGARAANVEQARGVYDENVATYRQAVLTAMQEVETQLAALRIYEQEAGIQDEAAELAERGVSIALNRYQAGIDNYTNVVVAKNSALSNQQKSIVIAQQRLNASVLLIKALGGSWQTQNKTLEKQPSSAADSKTQQSSQNNQTDQRPGGQS